LPVGKQYILHSFAPAAKYTFVHDPFTIVTQPNAHSLCGNVSYDVTFNGAVIEASSEPMAHDDASRTFSIYTEDYNLLGLNDITV
jgi:hypothetical protein